MISTTNKIKQGQTEVIATPQNNAILRDSKKVVADVNGNYTIAAEDFTTKYLICDSGTVINVVFPEGLVPDLKGEIIALNSNNTVCNFVNGSVDVNLNPLQGAKLSIQGEGVWGARALAVDKYSVYGSLDPLPVDPNSQPGGKNFTGTAIDLSNVLGNNYNHATFSTATAYTVSNLVVNGFARCFINAATKPTISGATVAEIGNYFEPSRPMEMVLESPNGTSVEYYFILR
jgi:hypothetical protein